MSEALTYAARQNSEVHSATVRAIGSPMSKRQPEKTSIARRKLLAGGVVLAGSAASAALSTASAGAADDNLPPHVPAWMKEQERGVSQPALWSAVPIREERHPPASRSDADEYCGLVDDAMAKPAWDHYTEWSAFRAASCRRAGDRSGSASASAPRSRQAAAHLHHGRHCPLSIRVARPIF